MQFLKNATKLAFAGLVVAVVGVSGCSTAKRILEVGEAPQKNLGPCPEAFALYEASRLVEFKGAETFANVGFTAEIEKVRSLCRYFDTRPISADLSLDIAFGRGPAASGQTATYEYFVAVTRKDIEVIEKQIFPITVTFPQGVDVVEITENIGEITIPRANENTSGANFEIIVGFELTPEQIAFNADGKRFRVSAGKN
ncbi:MAG: hypothetical protein COA91_07170 [Robiginitomaculum sp.]|nr:MAG: hypothetical protein COA91_07170 [Robiginitomaculum sp.]